MERIYCPQCEAQNLEDAVVCTLCGHQLSGASAKARPRFRDKGAFLAKARPRFKYERTFRVGLVAAGFFFAAVMIAVFLDCADPVDVLRTAERRFGENFGLLVAFLFWGACVAVAVLFVCIPGCVADDRQHHNRQAIWATTILFGWTFLGWGIALIWALTNPAPAIPAKETAPDR